MSRHDSPLCSQMGHYICEVITIWCPHEQRFTVVTRAGDETDDIHLDGRVIDFGPFDSEDDVVARATSELASAIRVTRRRWLETRQGR